MAAPIISYQVIRTFQHLKAGCLVVKVIQTGMLRSVAGDDPHITLKVGVVIEDNSDARWYLQWSQKIISEPVWERAVAARPQEAVHHAAEVTYTVEIYQVTCMTKSYTTVTFLLIHYGISTKDTNVQKQI